MKSYAQSVAWIQRDGSKDDAVIDTSITVRRHSPTWRSQERSVDCRPASNTGLSGPLRLVGILAFCQTIFFLVLFLFLCARAGAATESKPGNSLELVLSTYTTQTTRDPFGSQSAGATDTNGTAAATSVGADTLKVSGILYDAHHPSALVNDQLLELNRPVKMHTAQGEVEIKALKITRELVVLQVGEQTMELRLGSAGHN